MSGGDTMRRALGYLRRMMNGETLTVPGLLASGDASTDSTARRTMAALEEEVPGVRRVGKGRPTKWAYVDNRGAYAFCPWCGKVLPRMDGRGEGQ